LVNGFFLLLVRVPEIFAEVYSAQFLPVFKLSTSLYDLVTLSLYHGDKIIIIIIIIIINKIIEVLQHILLGVVIRINLSWRTYIFKVFGKVLREV